MSRESFTLNPMSRVSFTPISVSREFSEQGVSEQGVSEQGVIHSDFSEQGVQLAGNTVIRDFRQQGVIHSEFSE